MKGNVMSLLAKYTESAKYKPDDVLRFAIQDIKSAWDANPSFQDTRGHNAQYALKLWAEFDAYVVELQNRKGKQ
jgi:hypothetical protein